MPRYRRRQKLVFKPFRHPRQFAFFLGMLTEEQLAEFQNLEVDAPRVHPGAFEDARKSTSAQIIHALHAEHRAAKRGEHVGGGLGDALNSLGKTLFNVGIKPLQVPWNLASNLAAPLTHDNTVSEHAHFLASTIQQSYELDESKRADFVGDFVRDPALSTHFTDVWVETSSSPKHVVMSVRGTKEKADLGDDAMIAFGGAAPNRIGEDVGKMLAKYPNAYVELAGHSLGTQLIAESLAGHPDLYDQIDRVSFFNPASTPLMEGTVQKFTADSKVHFYENVTDLVGLGQMAWAEPPRNLVMKGPQSLNPLKNHSLDQWLPENEIEVGQLTPSQTEDILSGKTHWDLDESAALSAPGG